MNRGFTLVEVIAVIAIIGIISMLAIPNIINIFNSKKQALYDTTIIEIKSITKSYLIDNPNVFDYVADHPNNFKSAAGKVYCVSIATLYNNGYINISISTLCTAKYIDCPILDPRDGSNIDGYIHIYKDEKGMYEYDYISNN